MTEVYAREFLAPYVPCLYKAVQHGWDTYQNRFLDPAIEPRTRAGLIHDFAAEYAKNELCKHPTVVPLRINDRSIIKIQDQVLISFKKFDEQLLTSNYLTSSAKQFNAQQHLRGIPDTLPRFFVGYVAKEDFTELIGIFITFPKDSESLNWSFEISASQCIEAQQYSFEEQLVGKASVRVRPKIFAKPAYDPEA